jgi:hypothetical protein
MRVIASGDAMFGSTPGEIEGAVRLDSEGALFSLENETPRLMPSFPRIISQYMRSPISNLPTFCAARFLRVRY